MLLIVIAIIIDALIYKRIPTDGEKNKSLGKGLLFSVLAGISMGFFYRFVAAGMSLDYANLKSVR